MEQVIKKAIEGGYDDTTITPSYEDNMLPDFNKLFLDPLFWQALGKAEGWRRTIDVYNPDEYTQEWQVNWHKFIDHLAEGKDIDSFFKELLTTK